MTGLILGLTMVSGWASRRLHLNVGTLADVLRIVLPQYHRFYSRIQVDSFGLVEHLARSTARLLLLRLIVPVPVLGHLSMTGR